MRRKLFYALAAALLLPLSCPQFVDTCQAAEPAVTLAALPAPKADPIRITVPDEVLVGEDTDLAVTGLSVNDLVPGKVLFLPPESANVRVKLVVQWSLAGLEPVITFRAKQPGVYRLVIVKALPNEQLLAAQAVVTVKGDVKPPDPPEPPTPTKLTAVAIVEESADRAKLPLAQRQLLVSLTFPKAIEAKGLKYRKVDKDDNLPPEWAWAVKAAGAKLPALAFWGGSGDGSAIPLPADEAAAIREIEGRVKP